MVLAKDQFVKIEPTNLRLRFKCLFIIQHIIIGFLVVAHLMPSAFGISHAICHRIRFRQNRARNEVVLDDRRHPRNVV